MITPETISEKMMYSTVRLSTNNGSTGTGFFFNFGFDNGISVPVIITNKHVVNFNEKEVVSFYLHTKIENAPGSEKLNISFATDWYFHPSQDLCFCFVNPLLEQIKGIKQKDVFFGI